jgi:hypothetical protein
LRKRSACVKTLVGGQKRFGPRVYFAGARFCRLAIFAGLHQGGIMIIKRRSALLCATVAAALLARNIVTGPLKSSIVPNLEVIGRLA